MSSFENNGITAKGNNLLAKVTAGKIKLNYTKAVIGDGSLGQEQSIASLTNLISPKNMVSINRLVAVSGDPAWATVGFVYSNKNIASSYFLREIGIFATDPDEGEILYWYGNAGATADFIKPGDGTGSDIIEKKFDVGIYVGQSANVTATINGSLVFPTYEEFDAAIAAAKQYTDTKFSSIVIESATTSRPGVTQLSSSINSASESMAATPRAVKIAYDEAISAKQLGVEQKTNAVAALNSIGVPATISETWPQIIAKLASVIRATGTATVSQVLSGVTFSNATGNNRTGAMPNIGNVGNQYLTTQDQSYTIPAGYHNGQGRVTATYVNGKRYFSAYYTANDQQINVDFGFSVGALCISNSYGSAYVVSKRFSGEYFTTGGGNQLAPPYYPSPFTGTGLRGYYLYANGGTHYIQAWEA